MHTTVELTSQGLLIAHPLIQKWRKRGVDITYENRRIIIQPKEAVLTEKKRVLQILEATGLVVEPDWSSGSPPMSDAERAKLAQKFSAGRSLSEIFIEERAAGW